MTSAPAPDCVCMCVCVCVCVCVYVCVTDLIAVFHELREIKKCLSDLRDVL